MGRYNMGAPACSGMYSLKANGEQTPAAAFVARVIEMFRTLQTDSIEPKVKVA